MLGLNWMPRTASIVALACASGCQILNPAFGLQLGSDGDTTAGISASSSAAPTEPVLTTSQEPTTGTTGAPGTTDEPGTTEQPGTVSSTDPITTATDTDVDPSVPVSCGDGLLDFDEQCDDGDDDDTDECTTQCKHAFCGDGFVHVGEEGCDGGDNCTDACTVAFCGDGFVTAPEQCDDANGDNFDACSSNCQLHCGDGLWQPEMEECDPSAEAFAAYEGLCADDCRIPSCFRALNTVAVDIDESIWFDDCAKAVGDQVALLVRDDQGVRFLRVGDKAAEWTPVALTSAAPPAVQWKLSTHMSKIPLKDLLLDKPASTDLLYVFGGSSQPAAPESMMCPSSLGDGYAIAVLPEDNNFAARLLFMPYQGISNKPRNLGGWLQAGPGVELAYADDALMNLCEGGIKAQPFVGEFAFAVF